MTKPAIPSLILGKQLLELTDRLAVKKRDVMCIFGMGPSRWYQVTAKALSDTPLDSRYAILTRLLINHPQLYPITTNVKFATVLEHCKEVEPDIMPKHLALMLGLDINAGPRLMKSYSSKPTNAISLLLYIMDKAFTDAKTFEDRKAVYEMFRDNAIQEAKARQINLEEFWKFGGWKDLAANPLIQKTVKEKTTTKKKAKK